MFNCLGSLSGHTSTVRKWRWIKGKTGVLRLVFLTQLLYTSYSIGTYIDVRIAAPREIPVCHPDPCAGTYIRWTVPFPSRDLVRLGGRRPVSQVSNYCSEHDRQSGHTVHRGKGRSRTSRLLQGSLLFSVWIMIPILHCHCLRIDLGAEWHVRVICPNGICDPLWPAGCMHTSSLMVVKGYKQLGCSTIWHYIHYVHTWSIYDPNIQDHILSYYIQTINQPTNHQIDYT